MHVDEDGVRTVDAAPSRRLVWMIAAAIAVPVVVTIAAIVVIRMSGKAAAAPAIVEPRSPHEAAIPATDRRSAPPVAAPPAALSAVAAPAAAREHVVPHRVEKPNIEATPAQQRAATAGRPYGAPDDGPGIDAREAIPALIAAGEKGGITVFPLPGTKPIKRGVVVPPDYTLPEGYVRHFQTTDDGVQLPPILMFHPDYEFLNDQGQPITVPPDRVVPAALAPAGMPVQMLEVPGDKSRASGSP